MNSEIVDPLREVEELAGEFTATAWVGYDVNFSSWRHTFEQIWRFQSALPWWLGDILSYGEGAYGEDYAAVIPEGTRAAESLRVYKWVAEAIAPEDRVAELSWTHHRLVAGMIPAMQVEWLKRALEGDWSTQQLKAEIDGVNADEVTDMPDDSPHDTEGTEDDKVRAAARLMSELLEAYLQVQPRQSRSSLVRRVRDFINQHTLEVM